MNQIIRHFSAFVLAALPLAGTLAAFDPAIVPSDARWVVSLDLNAVRESAVGKELIELCKLPPVGEHDVANVRLDPKKIFETLGTATAYGTSFSKDPKEMDGVLILQGTADLRKLAEGYVAQATVTSPTAIVQLKEFSFEAYSLENGLIIGFPSEPIILLSRSKTQLVKALDVFRTHAGSIARTASPLSALLPTTGRNMLVAASVVPAADGLVPGDGPHARILQMANSAALTVGENDKTTSAHLKLVASNDEAADRLLKIAQGVAAMVSLAETDDKQLTEFLQSLNAVRDGKAVTLHLAYPTEGLVRIVHNLATKANEASHPGTEPAPQENIGKVVAQWTADQAIGQPTPTPESLLTKTIKNVSLKNGTIIILTGQRNEGENARLDYVEIVPTAGGQPLRFEAENMILRHYRVEAVPFASRGKLIIVTADKGTARFEFPGVDGVYTINVRYVDESDGKSTFTVSTQEPDQPAETK